MGGENASSSEGEQIKQLHFSTEGLDFLEEEEAEGCQVPAKTLELFEVEAPDTDEGRAKQEELRRAALGVFSELITLHECMGADECSTALLRENDGRLKMGEVETAPPGKLGLHPNIMKRAEDIEAIFHTHPLGSDHTWCQDNLSWPDIITSTTVARLSGNRDLVHFLLDMNTGNVHEFPRNDEVGWMSRETIGNLSSDILVRASLIGIPEDDHRLEGLQVPVFEAEREAIPLEKPPDLEVPAMDIKP